MDRPFDKYTHCAKCKRYIDEVGVRLKKITIGGDTYRHDDPEYLQNLKYEKICTDCGNGNVK